MRLKSAELVHLLIFLNRPEEFARQRRLKDRALIRYLMARNEAVKVAIHERAEVARLTRQSLSRWMAQTGSKSVTGLSGLFSARSEELLEADPRRLRGYVEWIKGRGMDYAMTDVIDDALVIQELLVLLGRNPIREFARFRPLIQARWKGADSAASRMPEDRLPTRDWAHGWPGFSLRQLSALLPGHDVTQLRRLVRRANQIVTRDWGPKLGGLERRAVAIIKKIGQPDQLLQEHLQACRHCGDVFSRPPSQRALQYCPACHRRWTSEQLWYRGGGRERLQRWRAEARRDPGAAARSIHLLL